MVDLTKSRQMRVSKEFYEFVDGLSKNTKLSHTEVTRRFWEKETGNSLFKQKKKRVKNEKFI